MVLALLFFLILPGGKLPQASADADSATSVGIVQVTPATQDSGKQFAYRLTFSCQNINASVCGGSPKITIPLGGAAGFPKNAFVVPTTPAVKSWDIVGTDLVFTLNDMVPGTSDQIGFAVTPPGRTTPNGTTWTWTPKLTFGDGGTPEATAPSSVTSTVTAKPYFTSDKKVQYTTYKAGDTVAYTIGARCFGPFEGGLNMARVKITDTLPAGVTYVSSSNGGVLTGNTVTWDFSGTGVPQSCGGTGPEGVTLTVKVNSDVTVGQVVKND